MNDRHLWTVVGEPGTMDWPGFYWAVCVCGWQGRTVRRRSTASQHGENHAEEATK